MTVTREEKIISKNFMMCITTIKAKTMRWFEHGARIERWKRSLYEMFNRQLSKERDYFERQGKVVRIALKIVLMKEGVWVCTVFRWFCEGICELTLCRRKTTLVERLCDAWKAKLRLNSSVKSIQIKWRPFTSVPFAKYTGQKSVMNNGY